MRMFRTFDLVNGDGKRMFTGYLYADAVAEQAWIRLATGKSMIIVPHNK